MIVDFQRKDVRIVSSLGKFLLDETLNDSLSTMLSVLGERRTSLEGANASLVEGSTNADLEMAESEKEGATRGSLLEHSWMGDGTYDLNSIAEVVIYFGCEFVFMLS